ncbi:hypothetical protein [Parvularcula dongshanensis]|uniref:Uncharacterized protein n=1 Tax=Parvularcula dongshanensis TaxID=1173995 RepID=A0A840I140_9PROT|nr:hypothetical protein [Parvularcula dongshanensis]MBB4658065.1 hypothetical protein [Parvularcula dongshanensis]
MIRCVPLLAALIGCSGSDDDTVSAMNYLLAPIEASCARDAVLAAEGFAVRGGLRRDGDAERFTALFNDDLPVDVIIRTNRDGTGEVSAFTRLSEDPSPLERREAQFAVETADEAIYRACTEDGRTYGDDAGVVIEAE